MARKSNNPAPPPVMTWGKAAPVLVIAAIFDAVALFFHFFWLMGPALAALYCTAKVTSWVGSLMGLSAAACAAGAGVLGTFGLEVTIPIGVVMAFAVGLLGWLTAILWILITNGRLFKEEAGSILWLIVGFIVDETPIIGALPMLLITVWRMYHAQIKRDREKMRAYRAQIAALEAEERQRQVAALMQARAMELEAANDEQYEEEQLAA